MGFPSINQLRVSSSYKKDGQKGDVKSDTDLHALKTNFK